MRTIIVPLLVFSLLLVYFCFADSTQISAELRRHGEHAELFFQAKKYGLAAESFDAIRSIMRFNTPIEVELNAAIALHRDSRPKEAEQRFIKLLKKNPADPRIAMSMCTFYQNENREKAEQFCALPKKWEDLKKSCSEFLNSCRWEEWENACVAGDWDSDNFKKLSGLSSGYFLAGKPKEALRAAKKAWKLYAEEIGDRLSCKDNFKIHVHFLSDPTYFKDGQLFTGPGSKLPLHRVISAYGESDDNCFAGKSNSIFKVLSDCREEDVAKTKPSQSFSSLGDCDQQFKTFVLEVTDAKLEIPGFLYTECQGYLGNQNYRSHVPMTLAFQDIVVEKPAAVIISYKIANFYHWVVEGLPKFLLLKEQVLDVNPESILVIPDFPHVLQFIEMFDIPKERINVVNGENNQVRFVFPKMYYVDWDVVDPDYREDDLFSSFYAPPGLLRKVSKEFAGEPLPLDQRNKIIWISRQNDGTSGARKINSEGFIIKALSKFAAKNYPFLKVELVSTSELSVSEQIALFKQARVIVGAHGAGLANMMWAGPNTAVVELPVHPQHSPCFGNLARVLGHSHWIVPEVSTCYYSPYRIDRDGIKRVLQTIASALGQQKHVKDEL